MAVASMRCWSLVPMAFIRWCARRYSAPSNPASAEGGDLHVLGEGIVDLPVARANLTLDALDGEEVVARQCVHAFDERGQLGLDDEILAFLHEGAQRCWDAPGRAHQHAAPALSCKVRVLLGARQGELFCDDPLRQDKPRMVETCLHDVGERAERIESRVEWYGQATPARIQP